MRSIDQCRACHCEPNRGDIGKSTPVSFPYLLLAAQLIERHQLHNFRLAKIGGVRIVETNVAVFTDTEERNINRFLR